MFKKLLALLLVAGFGVSAVSAFDSSSLGTVTITNNTGATIFNVYVSPGDASVWGPDLLDSSQTLSNGQSYTFRIDMAGSATTFDIMLVDSNGIGYTKMGQNIRNGRSNSFTFGRSDRGSAVDLNLVRVTLENTLAHDVWYLFVSPEESDHWGPDLLASDETLDAGDEYSFFVPVSSTTRYKVRAVDEDGDTYSFTIRLEEDSDDPRWEIEYSDMD